MTSASGPSVGSGAGVKKNPWNRRYCCVKGCHNHEGQPGIKFYRFPGRSYEIDRRKKWIAAVRRVKWRERRKKLEAQSCCDTTDSAEESTLLHEDPASQEGELLESLPSALDDSAEESTLLHEDTVSQEGQLLESLPSALDVLCMAIDAVEAMKEDKEGGMDLEKEVQTWVPHLHEEAVVLTAQKLRECGVETLDHLKKREPGRHPRKVRGRSPQRRPCRQQSKAGCRPGDKEDHIVVESNTTVEVDNSDTDRER
ncbi:hypothetical protein MTO96_022906 [Rhipicephalus appendiculatus]